MNVSDVLKPKSKDELASIVDSYIKEFEKTYLESSFVWRKGQRNVIIEIIQTYLEKKHSIIICDLPTGAGKSLVAMVVSFILNKQHKKGYILTSDTSLQDQYEKDINRFMLPWGSIKGIDHYTCIDNGEKYSCGTCKTRNKSPKSMHCFNQCAYINARDFASKSDTAILNYNYWLIMQNYVNRNDEDTDGNFSLFPSRDFTICDEAQKILDIVQNHYSPRFNKNTVEKLNTLSNFFNVHKVKDHSLDVNVIEGCIDEMWKSEDQDTLNGHMCSIENSLRSFNKSTEVLKDKIDEEYKHKKIPKEWLVAVYLSEWVKDLHCKVQDYNYIIRQTSTRNLVKNPSVDELVFNCLEEKYLMDNYFHQYTGFTVLMSATFADPKTYMKTINISSAKYIKAENTFSYEKSPIYYWPKRRMSYKQFDQNKGWLYEKINEIIESHQNESGLIHSASYDLTNKIKLNLSKNNQKRTFVYNGTEEKNRALDTLKMTNDKVIMGPSLITGINLQDDHCRFIIFPKIPFPSLNDRFIKTKMNIDPEWYKLKTIVNILQGAGRGIRSEKDWAITYILDACFGDLLHDNRKSFPLEFIQRIRVINE
jgi:ATP-dependent DNA helicase DinG